MEHIQSLFALFLGIILFLFNHYALRQQSFVQHIYQYFTLSKLLFTVIQICHFLCGFVLNFCHCFYYKITKLYGKHSSGLNKVVNFLNKSIFSFDYAQLHFCTGVIYQWLLFLMPTCHFQVVPNGFRRFQDISSQSK